jgi:hypothetical protein
MESVMRGPEASTDTNRKLMEIFFGNFITNGVYDV